MTSKISLRELVKNNMRKRSWLFFLTLIVGILLLPVAALVTFRSAQALELVDAGTKFTDPVCGWEIGFLQREFLQSVTLANPILAVAVIVDAFLAGITGFAFLDSPDQTDFYHSIPVKRKDLFWVPFFGGALTAVIPFLICEVLCIPLAAVLGVGSGKVILVMCIGSLAAVLGFLAVYAAVVLAMMLTGRIFTGVLMAIVILMYLPATITVFHIGAVEWFPNVSDISDPSVNLLSLAFSPAGLLFRMEAMRAVTWWIVMILYAAGFTCISRFIYCRRATEVQGDTFLTAKMNPVIKVLVGVAGAFVMGMVLSALNSEDQGLFMVVGVVLGTVLINFVMEFIYNPDIRTACRHWRSGLVFLGASLLVLIFFMADPFSIEKSLPAEAKIEKVGIKSNEAEAMIGFDINKINWDQFRSAAPDDAIYEKIHEIAGKSVREGREERNRIEVRFTLKSGKNVMRYYAADKEDILVLREMVEKKGKEKAFAIRQLSRESWGSISVSGWQVHPDDNDFVIVLRDKGKALTKALEKDCASMTCGQAEKKRRVCFLTVYPAEKDTKRQDTLAFPIYRNYHSTLQVLKDLGIRVEEDEEKAARKAVKDLAEIKSSDDSVIRCSITDPEEMAEFLKGVSVVNDYEFNEDLGREVFMQFKRKNGSGLDLTVRVEDPKLISGYQRDE